MSLYYAKIRSFSCSYSVFNILYTGHGDRHLTQTWVNVPVPTTRVIAE